MDKPVVLVVEEVYKKAKDFFDSVKEMEIITTPAKEKLLSENIRKKKAFAVVLGVDDYTGPLYNAMPQGGVIARFGVGFDGINLEKAKSNSLLVTNTPGVLDATVAEFTVFLAGEVLRKCGKANREMKQGFWRPFQTNDLRGKIWAVIGLGSIGKKVSEILAFGFGLEVHALDIKNFDPKNVKNKYGIEKISINYSEIVPHADIISLHLPADKSTHHFLNHKRLEGLKKNAIVINTARGALIDENALYDVLNNGGILGSGLDVFKNEPYEPDNPDKDLRELANVVLTPHIASSTVECSRRMAELALQNIKFALEKKYENMDKVL